MENSTVSAVSTTAPKHRWLTKGSKFAKKAVLSLTTLCCMATMFGTTAFAATGEVDTSSFITTACTVLKSVICLIGGGVGVWGVVNLLEGYGNDNPGAKSQGMKQLMSGLGLILLAIVLVPVLQNMMTGAV
ncbi:MAG: Maff2 family protein [Ruminococcus sp.]|nr:Maff2 family protein [Ruminococcus sp.]